MKYAVIGIWDGNFVIIFEQEWICLARNYGNEVNLIHKSVELINK